MSVAGTRPWLPWPLHRSPFWTAPLAAERAAALRIGVALVLLADLAVSYLPGAHWLYGGGSMGAPAVFGWLGQAPNWSWSLLGGVESRAVILTALWVWALLAVMLALGLYTRPVAWLVWALNLSFAHLNPLVLNGGDQVRGLILFCLALSSSGATWSLDARRRRFDYVQPWPLRLLLVQMALIYVFSGVYKVAGGWQSADTLYLVLADLRVARLPFASIAPVYALTTLAPLPIALFQLGFPLWIYLRRTRTAALALGAAFHVGLALTLDLGCFQLYMLCLYLPLVPWERRARPLPG